MQCGPPNQHFDHCTQYSYLGNSSIKVCNQLILAMFPKLHVHLGTESVVVLSLLSLILVTKYLRNYPKDLSLKEKEVHKP